MCKHLHLNILHSSIFSVNMLGERMKWYIIVGDNDKINLKNKLNIGECIIF
jgi:hypothetical protein